MVKQYHSLAMVLTGLLAVLCLAPYFVLAEALSIPADPAAITQRLVQARERQHQATDALLPLEKDLIFLANFEQDNSVFLGNTGVFHVPFDQGHYRPGKFGRGFYFEKLQNNLLPPDIANVETNLNGFQPIGGAALAGVETNTAFGRQALRASLPEIGAGFQTLPVKVAWHSLLRPPQYEGYVWTLLGSCYVKGPKDGKISIEVTFVPRELKLTSTNEPARIPDTNTPQEIILTGDWQRIACTAAADLRLQERYAVFSLKAASPIAFLLADGFQCEQAAYYPFSNLMPTTWTPGGQSVPASSVSLGSPLREMFPVSEGTIAFWTLTPRESNLSNPGAIFWISFGVNYGRPGWGMSGRFDTPGAGAYVAHVLGNATDGSNWHHLAMSWGPTNGGIYKDGQLIGRFARTNQDISRQVETFSFVLGGYYADGETASSIMDDVAIFKRQLTATEIGELTTGPALRPTANTILFSKGARSVYYRDERDAAIEVNVTSLESTTRPLNVDCSIGDLVLSNQATTIKPGITTVRFGFSPARLKCGVYTCKVGTFTGAKGVYAETPVDVVPTLRKDHFILSSWGGGGETAAWRAFCKTIGLNTIDSYDENIEQLGKNGFLYNWHYNFGNGVWNAKNRKTVRNGTRKEAAWRAVYPNWRSTLLNSEGDSRNIPDAENRKAWFDVWAENELGFPIPTNGWQLGHPDSCWFAEAGKPGTNGIYKESRTFKFLYWWYNRGCGWWRLNAEAAAVIKEMRPDVKCWTDPLRSGPGQIADLDGGSTWSYQIRAEPLIGTFESSYAAVRGSDKEYYATLGMNYVNELVENVRLPDGATNNLATTADDLIQQAWIVVTHIPTDGLNYWCMESLFYGLQKANRWYAEPGTDVKLGTVLKKDLLPIGTMLKHAPNAQRPLALLLPESTQWMCAGEGGWNWGTAHYPNAWKNWVGAMGIPYDVVLDHNIIPGVLAKYKAIIFPMAEFVSEKVYNELVAAGKAGTQIIVDSYCKQEYPNMVRLNQQEYDYHLRDKKKFTEQEQATVKFLTELKARLLPRLDAYAVGAEGKVITNIREADGVKYVSVINDNRQDGPYTLWTTNTFKPYGKVQKAKVFLRIPAGSAVYEFTQSRKLPLQQEGDHWVTTVDLPSHAGRLLCLYPAPIKRIAMDADKSYAAGKPGVVTVTILDSQKQAVPGRQLLQVDIIDPDGNRHDESGLYRAVKGQARIPFRPAMNDRPGTWRITITERTSGISQTIKIRVTGMCENL